MKSSIDSSPGSWLEIKPIGENPEAMTKYDVDWARHLMMKNPISRPLGTLHNLGNSCFINAVLQCLVYTPGFEYFTKNMPNLIYELNSEKACYLYHFAELCRAMHTIPESAPHMFYGQISQISPLMRSGLQQDAHEFLLSLLNKFDDECLCPSQKTQNEATTPIRSFFAGKMKETTTCTQCRHEHKTVSSFFDINLPLTSDSISGCLENYMMSQEVASFECEKCKNKCTATKKQQLIDLPNVLILSLIRFQSNGKKMDDKITIDDELNLRLFNAYRRTAAYKLYGMICHEGRAIDLGHYYSLTRCGNSEWFQHNDSSITKIDKDLNELNLCPYILFYKRHDHLERMRLTITIECKKTVRTSNRKANFNTSSDEQQLSEASDGIPIAYSGSK
ncbi:Clan CA, family C19, ubiquitin hydrolase-like cysteine peptidase [Trichomonas vaginalis G3]|uniref:ubiquitinyl hydrolase 1 n=1 Tax=Trichomonas vaginalis (strain ATCC PRA-98 / G3) TaxID=412133 RepID=A2DPF0_TRIV3|nr:ubiquitinyl hydrolase protein [Trichomonas vaginalis G3]EAY17694.1 Clan CA, family C19, ubiquitin hydrolase-like cysteine peptidase [Trichomonas vaginalis G3]KAI5507902.1 ubiquitinyl hydrolase protein [Trichomonas vaginalis G3]|eukprot:XP_001329829.1 Clan CA, family C19, ubiquitin hydrolase-like cysteine peptidase [Trichomonas vaginalis G3]